MSTLSVHLSNYNDADSIGEALEAICTQSRQPDELIIVDDGSTDNSLAVINEYIRRFPFVQVYQNQVNRGIIYTINLGLQLAKGDYIYFASANDKVLPGLFEKSMNLLNKYPQASMCCTDGESINVATGKRMTDGYKSWGIDAGFVSGKELAARHKGLGMFGTSYITRRSLMIEMGAYNPDLKWHCDYFLNHMIAFRYGTCYIPEDLARWNYNPDHGYSNGRLNAKEQIPVMAKAIELACQPEYADLLPLLISSRFFNPFQVVMNFSSNIAAILQSLNTTNYSNSQVLALYMHLFCQSAKLSSSHVCRQIYAHTFHHYDRLRQKIRRMGEESA